MFTYLNRLRHWAGVDRPVFFSGLGQAWSLFSGPIGIFLVTRFFTAETQGYFYTFDSVLSVCVFLEMGFSQSIIQFASHEFAQLKFGPLGVIEGDARARSRLVSLGRLSIKWYGVCALLAVVGLAIGGYWFFSIVRPSFWPWLTWSLAIANTGAVTAAPVYWIWPWFCLCLCSGLSLLLLPMTALLEGCNQMSFVYGLRTLSRILQSVVMWVAILAGASLFTGPLVSVLYLMVAAGALLWRWRGLLGELWRVPQGEVISWRNEIWPFQWKIAVSWMSGYFIFSFFVPVLFRCHGEVVAGQMGATLKLIMSLNALASVWTLSKGPRFGVLISQRKYGELDRLFFKSTVQSVGICIAGGVALLAALVFVRNHFAMGGRFIDPVSTSLLVFATITNQVIFGQAIYLRAHKQEPFLWISLINGILTGVLILILGYFFAARGVCIAYSVVQIIMLFWASTIWKRCRRQWHAAD